MHHKRAVFRRVAEIVNTREPKLPASLFFDYFRDTYGTSQSAAVRRQAELSPRVVSLRGLLDEIQAEPERMSRQRFVGVWPPRDQPRGHDSFDRLFAGDVGEHLDPAIVGQAIAGLESEAKRLVEHVDQYIAHSDESPFIRASLDGSWTDDPAGAEFPLNQAEDADARVRATRAARNRSVLA